MERREGVSLGLVAGYRGGWLDEVVMRVTDGLLAFPALVPALAITAALGPESAATAESSTPPELELVGWGYPEMAPWLSVAPGGAIFMITLSFNFVSDALDRRLRL